MAQDYFQTNSYQQNAHGKTKNPKIIQQWKKKISRMEEIHPFSDMLLAPVDIDIVLERINDLVSKRDTGIYHLARGSHDFLDALGDGVSKIKLSKASIKHTQI